ncbi:MAG: FeoB small GTPase domain-containing protein, partial [Fidelibacterota bacterium]
MRHRHGHGHGAGERIFKGPGDKKIIALVGNPNVGKSVIFNRLTGKYVNVSNYPGTTVEISTGYATFDARENMIIDTPGVNNLIPSSEDEQVARDILLENRMRTVIQVADSKNLRRTLLLTLQLAEMRIPMLLNLNMSDEAAERGIKIDAGKLSEILGIPVVHSVAVRREGIDKIVDNLKHASVPEIHVVYDRELENALNMIEKLLPESNISKRSIGLMLLAGDRSLSPWVNRNLAEPEIKKIEKI